MGHTFHPRRRGLRDPPLRGWAALLQLPRVVFVRKGRPRGCRHTRAAESQVAAVLAGRVAGTSGSSRSTPRGPTATSRLTGRPLRRFDVS
jgi:hypothetical protein